MVPLKFQESKSRILINVIFILLIFYFNCFQVIGQEVENNREDEFYEWLIKFKERAHKEYNINKNLLDEVFFDTTYKPKVIALDKNQPEFIKTFKQYYDNAVNPTRIKKGKQKSIKYDNLLTQVEKKYKIPRQIILAFWGMETNYGQNKGKTPIIDSLATLAFDNRRKNFFFKELISALQILEKNNFKKRDLVGSWAGAFGHFQFMPSTYLAYAVDCDNDNKIDLVNSLPDAMCSAGNFLSKLGWNNKYIWGRVVKITDKNSEMFLAEINKKSWNDLSYFTNLGVRKLNGDKISSNKDSNLKSKLIAPMGIEDDVFIVYKNFEVIMNWNRSTNYALSIGLLSDKLK